MLSSKDNKKGNKSSDLESSVFVGLLQDDEGNKPEIRPSNANKTSPTCVQSCEVNGDCSNPAWIKNEFGSKQPNIGDYGVDDALPVPITDGTVRMKRQIGLPGEVHAGEITN